MLQDLTVVFAEAARLAAGYKDPRQIAILRLSGFEFTYEPRPATKLAWMQLLGDTSFVYVPERLARVNPIYDGQYVDLFQRNVNAFVPRLRIVQLSGAVPPGSTDPTRTPFALEYIVRGERVGALALPSRCVAGADGQLTRQYIKLAAAVPVPGGTGMGGVFKPPVRLGEFGASDAVRPADKEGTCLSCSFNLVSIA